MLSLSWIFKLNNYISEKFYRPPPFFHVGLLLFIIDHKGGSIMDDYLLKFREMISLRGLTDHTVKSYSTYIHAYLDYLSGILHKMPEDVSWAELREFIRWIQNQKHLSDRTMNACISQLRFFTIYVLHKPWDPTQLPFRKFDAYLPYVPSQEEVFLFIDSFSNLKHKAVVALMYSAGLRVGEVCRLRYEDISRSSMRIHIRSSKNRSDRFAILSKNTLDILTCYWFEYGRPSGFLFPTVTILPALWLPIRSISLSLPKKRNSGGSTVSPAIRSGMLLAHTFMRMALTCLPLRPCLAINP